MDPDGKHRLQNRDWRLDVEDPRLDRPWTKARSISLFLHGDGQVLMPWDFPVGLGRLVKQQAPNREGFGGQNRFYQRSDLR